MGQFKGFLGQSGELRGKDSAFALFFGDINLKKNVLNHLQLGGTFVNSIQQTGGIHRLNQVDSAHHLLDLVGLQMADKMQPCTGVGVVIQMGRHFLHPVLTADLDSAGNGGANGIGSLHLGGGHQSNFGGVAPCPQSSCRNTGIHRCNIIFQVHPNTTFPSYRSVAATMISSPARRILRPAL